MLLKCSKIRLFWFCGNVFTTKFNIISMWPILCSKREYNKLAWSKFIMKTTECVGDVIKLLSFEKDCDNSLFLSFAEIMIKPTMVFCRVLWPVSSLLCQVKEYLKQKFGVLLSWNLLKQNIFFNISHSPKWLLQHLDAHAMQHIALQARGKCCQRKFLNILREENFVNFRGIR